MFKTPLEVTSLPEVIPCLVHSYIITPVYTSVLLKADKYKGIIFFWALIWTESQTEAYQSHTG